MKKTEKKTASPVTGPGAFGDLFGACSKGDFGEVKFDFADLMDTHPALRLIFSKSGSVFWVLDLRTMRYPFMSGNVRKVLGYEAKIFTDHGPDFFNGILHPQDLRHYAKLTRHIWDFLITLPSWQRRNYSFNCDYRIRKANGEYTRLLERYTVLQTDNQGTITHLLGTGTDISSWKKNDTMVASLICTDDNTCLFCTPEDPIIQPQELLSKRERQVVQLLAEGLSSKHISQKLNISFHTVNTHRQNMIEKTHSHNTIGLVQFALSHGLI